MANKKRRSQRRGEPDLGRPPATNTGGDEESPLAAPAPPDPEVSEKAQRRQYSAEYKLRILKEADACKELGEVGALLRREGLYSSLLSTWRRQRDEGTLAVLSPGKRGRKAKRANPLSRRVEELERENRKLQDRLKQAEAVIDVQKKVSEILRLTSDPEKEESD